MNHTDFTTTLCVPLCSDSQTCIDGVCLPEDPRSKAVEIGVTVVISVLFVILACGLGLYCWYFCREKSASAKQTAPFYESELDYMFVDAKRVSNPETPAGI